VQESAGINFKIVWWATKKCTKGELWGGELKQGAALKVGNALKYSQETIRGGESSRRNGTRVKGGWLEKRAT